VEIEMSDDRKNTGAPDRDRINLNEDYEVQYWVQTLGITRDELKAAVEAVGPTANAVREHLRK
jgi:hypothetical protein